jgi:hypothetical protein
MAADGPTDVVLTIEALAPNQWCRMPDGRLAMRLGGCCDDDGIGLVILDGVELRAVQLMTAQVPCTPLQSVTLSATWTPIPGG